MSEPWILGLLTSLLILAIGTSLKSAHDTFLLKQSDKEITRLRSEIESLNNLHDEGPIKYLSSEGDSNSWMA